MKKGDRVIRPDLMKTMKKILVLLLTVALMTTVLPLAAYAEESMQAEENTLDKAAELNVDDNENTEPEQQEASNNKEQNSDPAVQGSEQNVETESSQDTEATQESEPGEPASEENVVTLGENLSDKQKNAMYEYFGTSAEQVKTIVVTHADEVKYMEGIATAQQIGATTNSCAYVEPTDSGGIKVKTANLNFVTSAMIASTLTTAGMENCNVIAACPFEVSGTGALTGIIMAYETASGDALDEGQKEAAMEELITTGELADSVGQKKATDLISDIKTRVIDENLTEQADIQEAVEKIAEDNDVSLTDKQKDEIVELMEKISQFDYDLGALKDTLNNLDGKLSGLAGIWNSIKSFFVGTGNGILNDTNDEALGADVITDSTVDESGFKDGLWTRIKNFFTGSDEDE